MERADGGILGKPHGWLSREDVIQVKLMYNCPGTYLLRVYSQFYPSTNNDVYSDRSYHLSILPGPVCGGLLGSSNTSFSSPYYPNYYLPNITCIWMANLEAGG